MKRAALVVHSFSYPFIKNVALFIHDSIQTYFDAEAKLLISKTVDGADYAENTYVFLIGENFPLFRRRPGCTYVYLNFSVVTVLGRPLDTGIKARKAIFLKRRMLAARLPLIDIVLDYYPPQTKAIRNQLKVPVLGFDVATFTQRDYTAMQDRNYDVCFVGNMNKRRQSICDAIEAKGLSLSPSNDIVIEDAAAQSRICLNVHSVKSHHLETPRFVAALSVGTPIVTEPSYGAEDVMDSQYTMERAYADLPTTVAEKLSQSAQLNDLGQNARHWYKTTYLPRAQANWRETCDAIRAIA